MILSPKKLNPNAFQLLKYCKDPNIRMCIMFGGSSSGKSYSAAQVALLLTLNDKENTLVLRKVGASIETSIYEDFKVAAAQLGITHLFKFKKNQIKCYNGAKIDFKGLDNDEKIKGISNYMRILMEELSEFDLKDFKQLRKRLRGKKGQKIIADFNPIKETHWIKKDLFDLETFHDVPMSIPGIPDRLTEVKSIRMNSPKQILNPRTRKFEEHAPDMVVIQSTYLNNFWVVGSPDGTYGYYDEQCIADFEKDRINDPDYYNVYALGEWGVIRTGSEFLGSFNVGKHCWDVAFNPRLPIHISVDNNRLPYIAVTFWQVKYSADGDVTIYQIDEVCAKSPDNTARKAAKLVAGKLKGMVMDPGYPDTVYLHGDASTKAGNTIDDENRSFLDLFIDTLQKEGIDIADCVGSSNPSVSMSGEYINAIFDEQIKGVKIVVGYNCKTSIEDYQSVQKDANGAMSKVKIKDKVTLQTYEEHGHLTDTFRYIVIDVLNDGFIVFSNKRKRNLYAKDGAIHFFNPKTDCKYSSEIVYVMPNVNGKFCMVHGKKCGQRWHVVGVAFRETSSTEEIKGVITSISSPTTIIECAESYYPFVRDLRKTLPRVKVLGESPDIDRRISATSDYVRDNILFNPDKADNDSEYSAFMANLLDYNKDADQKECSAVLSGFARFAIKST